MLLVDSEDARQVTEAMLADPETIKLIDTYSKVLSGDKQKWLTFEQEAYDVYRALRKWGNFIMQCTIDHKERHLVGLFLDSTTALSQWMSSTVPGSIDVCSAKEMRFRSWADKVGYVRYMNMYMNWWPGGVNDWADLLSRIADKLAECAEEREKLAIVMPVQQHSYHTGHRAQKNSDEGVPAGYRVEHLEFDQARWEKTHQAYPEDKKSVVLGAKLCGTCKTVTMDGAGVDPGI